MPADEPQGGGSPAGLPTDADVELDAVPRLDPALRARLLTEIAPIALAIDLRRWRAAVAGRAREERMLADVLRAGRVGSAPLARVSIGAELDLRLRELVPSPAGIERGDVAARLAEAREALVANPDDLAAARRWVRLRLLAGSLRAHGPATPAAELIDSGDGEGAVEPEEAAQVAVSVAIRVAEGTPSPGDVADAIRRLRAVAAPDLAAALPAPEPAEWRRRRAVVESARMRLLVPALRTTDWGGPHADEIDWLAWAAASTRRPAEARETIAPRLRRRAAVAAAVLPALAAAAAFSILEAPDAGRIPQSQLTSAPAPPAAGAPVDHIVAAGLEVTDDWSSVTVQFAAPPRVGILEVQLAGVAGEIVAATGAGAQWSIASVTATVNPAVIEARTDGATLVLTLLHTLRPTGVRVIHFTAQLISPGVAPVGGSKPAAGSSDALPAEAGVTIPPVRAPPPGADWSDLAFALAALAGAAAGSRVGLTGAAAAFAGLAASLAAGRLLAIPVAKGLAHLTGDERSATAAAVALMAALAAAGIAAGAATLTRREPIALRLARVRVEAAALPRVVSVPAAALAGLCATVVAAAIVALICVDLGPLGIAALRSRASITGSRAVDVARWVFGA